MRLELLVVVLATAFLSACSAPTARSANAARDAAGTCEASWRETLDWAVRLQAEPSTSMGPAHMPLVTADVPPDLDVQQAVIDLWLSGDQVHEGLREALDGPALSAGLEHWLKLNDRLAGPGDPPSTVSLAVEPDVKWGLVVESVERIRSAGYAQVGWLFVRPTRVPKPSWWWRDPQSEQATRRSYERSPSWAWRASLADQREVLDQVLSSCPELARVSRTNATEFLAALRSSESPCRCRIDQRGLQSVLWAAHPADESTARVLRLVHSDDVRATIIEAPADAPWSQVGPRIAALPSRALVRLRVAAP